MSSKHTHGLKVRASVRNPKATEHKYLGPDKPTVEELQAMVERANRENARAADALAADPRNRKLAEKARDAASILAQRQAELAARLA